MREQSSGKGVYARTQYPTQIDRSAEGKHFPVNWEKGIQACIKGDLACARA